MRTPYELRVAESVQFLKIWAKNSFVPDVAVVLGSGLSGVFAQHSFLQHISFNDLPGFKAAAVKGHSGELGLVEIAGKKVAVLMGRVHGYEGYDPGEVVHNVRTMIKWGCRKLILTNASGCLEKSWKAGEVMLICDQINATGVTPLAGPFGNGFGARFVDMKEAYSRQGIEAARTVFAKKNILLREGVYCGVFGPAYETPAEVKMLQTTGCQAVGMSTVLETLAARQLGCEVLGLACLSNLATGLADHSLTHDEVIAMGKGFEKIMAEVMPPIIEGF